MLLLNELILVILFREVLCEEVKLACEGKCHVYLNGKKADIVDNKFVVDDSVNIMAVKVEMDYGSIGGVMVESKSKVWNTNSKNWRCIGEKMEKNVVCGTTHCTLANISDWKKIEFDDKGWNSTMEVQKNEKCNHEDSNYNCFKDMSKNAIWIWLKNTTGNTETIDEYSQTMHCRIKRKSLVEKIWFYLILVLGVVLTIFSLLIIFFLVSKGCGNKSPDNASLNPLNSLLSSIVHRKVTQESDNPPNKP